MLIPIVPRADSGWYLVVPLMIAGAGLGLLVSQLNNYTLAPISEERVSEAAGVNSAAGSFGLSFGLAFAGAIMLATLSFTFTNMAESSTVLAPAEQQRVADALEHDAEVMSNTQLQQQLAGEPQQTQDEIISINTDARHRALQVALLIPILAGLIGLFNVVPDDAHPRPAAIGRGRRHGAGLNVADAGNTRSGISRRLPILAWLPRYDRGWLRGDVAAGVAVTALIVPKNLGYAGIAGVPLQNGLYAAAAGAIIYALFCTSRQISTGPSSSLAAVAGGAVLLTGLGGDQAAELVAAITLVAGVLFLLLAVFRLGWIARFLSKPVITGFLAGAAVDVVIGELPKLTGTSADGVNAWRELGTWLRTLGDVHWTTMVVGVVALAVILGLRFVAPAVPGALVLVAGGILASYLFDLGANGVDLVGDVPRGLPTPQLPSVDLFRDQYATIGVAAAALLLIGFSQTAGDARAFATRHHYRIDVDQESVAQGMANVGAGVFQGMPVSTSLSASSLNESAGARTPVASLITGALVILTLIVLAPLFSDLPKAGAGRRHHRRGRVRDDRPARAAPAPPRHPVRFLDRDRGHRRRAVGRRPGRCRGGGGAIARLADLCRHQPADAAAGPRGRHPGVPRPGRAPGR